MKFHNTLHNSLMLTLMMFAGATAFAQVSYDFESADQMDGNSEISGDLPFWIESADQNQTASGSQSLKFDATAATEPFRNFSYDVPIDITEGTVSVWFYDTVGQGGGGFNWAGSVILEDANNPADFIAVEINELPYAGAPGALPYHASEGIVDRGITGDSYDADSLAARTVGWHEIVFNITAAGTTVSVDGSTADEVGGPLGGTNFRLRFMADSAKAGGFANWTTAESGYPAAPGLVYFDDVTFTATSPAADSATLDFEDDNGSGDPEYDVVGSFMGPAAYNEPNMRGFINTYEVSTDQAHAGTNSVTFAGGISSFKNIEIDLSTVTGPATITIPFYDALGQNSDFDKIGAAFILEDGSDPSNFIATEIWNAPYPTTGAKKYYFTARPIPFGSGFYSNYFPERSIGWQTLTIELTDTYSRMTINGVGADGANSATVYDGPGLSTNPKLRIMADSPTMGGFNNWQDNSAWTDSETPELDALYFETNADYIYIDDIELPLPASTSVENWEMF